MMSDVNTVRRGSSSLERRHLFSRWPNAGRWCVVQFTRFCTDFVIAALLRCARRVCVLRVCVCVP